MDLLDRSSHGRRGLRRGRPLPQMILALRRKYLQRTGEGISDDGKINIGGVILDGSQSARVLLTGPDFFLAGRTGEILGGNLAVDKAVKTAGKAQRRRLTRSVAGATPKKYAAPYWL